MRLTNNTMIFYWRVVKESIIKYFEKDMLDYAAALSYYMLFSLPSMLIVILWSTAQFYSEAAVRQAILIRISSRMGEQEAEQIMATLDRLHISEPSWWASMAGLAVLLFFATSLFNGMRTALNQVIQVKPTVSTLWGLIRIRFIAFALLAILSLFLLFSIFLNTIMTGVGSYLVPRFGEVATYMMAFNAFLLDLGSTAVLFALYFRYLPDAKLRWKDVWLGALLTAGMFLMGKNLLNLFVSSSEATDLYAAAGSVLVLLLWVYYAMAIILFGATFTFTRAKLLNNEQAL
ncbi:MAG: YihY/virulence factor BrkB family protein [Sulfurimonadaceae bacterium]